VIRSRRVVAPHGEIPACVHVAGGRIERVSDYDEVPSGCEVFDLGELALLPGFVDSHVHVNEPGRTGWEGFASATRAAAAGGITTIVDMPLNSIPATTTVAAFQEKLAAAEGQLTIDVAFWGGVVPGNTAELRGLHDAGVVGFKCFLAPSGVNEFENVSLSQLEEALAIIAELGSVLLVHAEDPGELSRAGACADPYDCGAYAATRPVSAELEAVRGVIAAAERTGGRVHIVHVSASETLREIAAARARGVRVTSETCPHYLWFAAEDVPRGGTLWKCAPPLRDAANRESLRAALRAGDIDLVASDHSPAPPELKSAGGGDFLQSWGGIASLQLAPLAAWTVAADGGATLPDLSRWYAAAPAELAGLHRSKGSLSAGMDADFVVLDPDGETVVKAGDLHHRHKATPYAGARLRGRIVHAWLRGAPVTGNAEFGRLRGRTLLRGQP
jgi:allantoinase